MSVRLHTETIKIADNGSIIDSENNEIVKFNKVSSAVNEIKITNAATGTAPIIAANGDDNNINLQLKPQGSGVLELRGGTNTASAKLRLMDACGSEYLQFDAPSNICSSYTLTLPSSLGTATQVLSIGSISETNATLQWVDNSSGGGGGGGSGDITGVVAGNGLTGGALTGCATLTINPIQTTINSVTNPNLKIGSGCTQEYIDFSCENQIITKINNNAIFNVASSGVTVTGNTTLKGRLRLNEPSPGSEYIDIRAPNIGSGASYSLTLPNSLGTNNQILSLTDVLAGSAKLQWVTQSSGSGGCGDITNVVAGNGLTGGASSGCATLTINPIQTTITSVTNPSLKIGTGCTQEYIDFSCGNQIITKINNSAIFNVASSGVTVTGVASTSATIKDTSGSSTTSGGKLVLACDDNAALEATHRLGVLEFQGSESSLDTLITGARIEAVTGTLWTEFLNTTNLDFYTTVGNACEAKVLSLTGAGTNCSSNYLNISSTGSNFGPIISAAGSVSNIPIDFRTKGTGVFQFSSSTSSGKLRLMDTVRSSYVQIDAPSIVCSSYTLTLPSSLGTENQVLSINSITGTNANLAWVNQSSSGSGGCGDITNVVAGNGLTGGASSGCATLTINPIQTTITSVTNPNLKIGTGTGCSNEYIDFTCNQITLKTNNTARIAAVTNGAIINGKLGLYDNYDNIIIGPELATSLTNGNNNVIIGKQTANTMVCGANNIVIGYQAANAGTFAGNRNIILGDNAASFIGNGSTNIVIGYKAASSGTFDGISNIILGWNAAQSITTGSTNTILGYKAASSGTFTGENNLILGREAAYSITSGNTNTILGSNAARSINIGGNNTIIGSRAAKKITTGNYNTILGDDAGTGTELVSGNTSNTNTSNSTVVLDTGELGQSDDFYNGYIITVNNGAISGSDDMVALITDYVTSSKTATISVISGAPSIDGSSLNEKEYTITSGIGLTTGAQNTCIGYSAGVSAANASNQTSLGKGAQCTGNNQITLGNVDVTTLRCATSTIASISDNRDKTDIVDSTYGLDFINNIKPRQFTWNTRGGSSRDGKTNIGFIAQELQSVMGEGENDILDLVLDINPEKLEIKPGNLIPILVKAVKDLSAANTALEARVAALENA